jgi:hypothetical protein
VVVFPEMAKPVVLVVLLVSLVVVVVVYPEEATPGKESPEEPVVV